MITALIILALLICLVLSLIVIGLNEYKEEIWQVIDFKGDDNMACGKKKKGKKK